MVARDERSLVEDELHKMREEAARADRWQWRGLWIVTVVVFVLLSWLVFRP